MTAVTARQPIATDIALSAKLDTVWLDMCVDQRARKSMPATSTNSQRIVLFVKWVRFVPRELFAAGAGTNFGGFGCG